MYRSPKQYENSFFNIVYPAVYINYIAQLREYKNSVCASKGTQISIINTILFTTKKIIAVGCENYIKHIWRQIKLQVVPMA
jgi:hypothetical protein